MKYISYYEAVTVMWLTGGKAARNTWNGNRHITFNENYLLVDDLGDKYKVSSRSRDASDWYIIKEETKTMRGSEVVKAMEDGFKVTKQGWCEDEYLMLNDGEFVDQDGWQGYKLNELVSRDWKIYEEPVKEMTISEIEKIVGCRIKVVKEV